MHVTYIYLYIRIYTCIHTYIFRYTHVITSTKLRLKQTWRLTKAIAEMKCECDTEQTMKLEQLCKVGSEYELNSWPDSSVG